MSAPPGDVSDTARWVAYLRALESDRPDALFRDPFARRLAGDRGRAIAESLRKGPLAWSLAIRTRVFDEWILSAVHAGGHLAVLNLAAGLDARPYRLPLPADLLWIEVDLPNIISHKSAVLAEERPACAVERVALDLSLRGERADFFAQLSARASRVLVVTEGLLVYLDEEDVASLADDLRRFFPAGSWILENAAPSTLATQRRRWGKTLRAAKAEHKFAPADGLDFFRPHGWVPRETKSLLDEAQRLKREIRIVSWLRRVEAVFPPLAGLYARRHAKYRNALLYAFMQGL